METQRCVGFISVSLNDRLKKPRICSTVRNHPVPARMSVFNPRILDASIRDVTSGLADAHKVDVLIYAMHHLHLERSVC